MFEGDPLGRKLGSTVGINKGIIVACADGQNEGVPDEKPLGQFLGE